MFNFPNYTKKQIAAVKRMAQKCFKCNAFFELDKKTVAQLKKDYSAELSEFHSVTCPHCGDETHAIDIGKYHSIDEASSSPHAAQRITTGSHFQLPKCHDGAFKKGDAVKYRFTDGWEVGVLTSNLCHDDVGNLGYKIGRTFVFQKAVKAKMVLRVPVPVKKVPTFKSLAEVRAWKFVGNHAADAAAFKAIEKFALSSAPLQQRADALRVMGVNGMGLSRKQAGYGIPNKTLLADNFGAES